MMWAFVWKGTKREREREGEREKCAHLCACVEIEGEDETACKGGSVHSDLHQGTLTEGEGSVQLTSLYQLVRFSCL